MLRVDLKVKTSKESRRGKKFWRKSECKARIFSGEHLNNQVHTTVSIRTYPQTIIMFNDQLSPLFGSHELRVVHHINIHHYNEPSLEFSFRSAK